MTVNIPWSKDIYKDVKAKRPELLGLRKCYDFCHIALTYYPNLIYVEGYKLIGDDPSVMSHAWLETKKGVILDPTNYQEPGKYAAIVKLTLKQLKKQLELYTPTKDYEEQLPEGLTIQFLAGQPFPICHINKKLRPYVVKAFNRIQYPLTKRRAKSFSEVLAEMSTYL